MWKIRATDERFRYNVGDLQSIADWSGHIGIIFIIFHNAFFRLREKNTSGEAIIFFQDYIS